MEDKIKVLEVNNIDLPGRRFNGYDLLNEINDETTDIKQAVIYKQSQNKNVIKILKKYEEMLMMEKLEKFEEELSIHSNLSITSPALINSKEYKEADVVHFHMFHNSKFSLVSLLQICSEKKVVMSFHDPWSITGRCVHFGECDKWKTGCENCENLKTLFKFNTDNCSEMWKLKKMIYSKINPEIVVSSKYMYDLVKQSPLTSHFTNVHIIPLGVDLNFFNEIEKENARVKFNIPKDNIVLFLRAQKALKGTDYIVQALKLMEGNKKITILTCDEKGRFDELKEKYNIIDYGNMNNEELLYAYNACDIFLMPSTGETFGMMAIEAMACSRPVVVFNNTALPDVTFAPECGFLVENKNSESLKNAIEFLIKNQDEREKRGKLGRKIVEENYSITKYNERLIDLYKNIKEQDIVENYSQNDIDTKESLKIKSKLNQFTKQNFKKDSNEYKRLYFSNIENQNEKIEYSNIEVQKVINEYNNKLYDAVSKGITNNIFIQIKHFVVLIFKDRKRLKNSIQYKLNQLFRKKD